MADAHELPAIGVMETVAKPVWGGSAVVRLHMADTSREAGSESG